MRPAVHNVTIKFLILFWMMAGAAMAAPTTTTAPTTQPVGPSQLYAHGSGDKYWITASVKQDAASAIETIVYNRTAAGKWDVIAQIVGQVVGLADYQGDLVAVMQDGSWRMVYSGGSTTGADPRGNGKVIALAGDGDVLYGIIRTGLIYELQSFSRGKWTSIVELPPVAQQGDQALVVLGIVDRQIIVAVRTIEHRVAVFSLQGKTWQAMGSIEPSEQIAELQVLPLGRQIGVWVSPGFTTGGAVYSNPPTWTQRIDLGKDPGEVAVASERLRLIYSGKDKDKKPIMEKEWDFSGKLLADQPVNLPESNIISPYITYAMWAIFFAVIALFLLRRKPPDEGVGKDESQ